MQHRIETTKRFPSDLKYYSQSSASYGLLSFARSFAQGISSATQTITSIVRSTSYSFIKMSSQSKPKPGANGGCLLKRKPPSKVTLKVIDEINRGFDPLRLSRERWQVEWEQLKKEQGQRVQQLIEKYQSYINKENLVQKAGVRNIRTIQIQKEPNSQIEGHLWFIAEQDLKLYRKKVEDWKKSQKLDQPPQNIPQPQKNPQLTIPQPQLLDKESFQLNEVIKIKPSQIQQTDKVSGQISSENCSLQLLEEKSGQNAKEDIESRLPRNDAQKQDQGKVKENPFLGTTVPKKVSLIDMMIKNSSNIFDSSGKAQSNLSQHNRNQANINQRTFPLFKQSTPHNTSSLHNNNSSNPNGSSTFGIPSIKKQMPTSQPAVITPFGSNFLTINNQKNQLHSSLPTQGNGTHQQVGIFPKQVGIFPRLAQKSSENRKQILDMFGKRISEETSLFNDARSQRTEKKNIATQASRRNNKKTNNLRVS